MRALLLACLCAATGCTSFPEAGRYACDSSHPDPRDCGGAPGVCTDAGWCQELAAPAGDTFAALSGNGSEVVVVGTHGLVAERDATGWSTSAQGSGDLRGVWLSESGGLWAVGAAGTGGILVHREAGSWTTPVLLPDALGAVTGTRGTVVAGSGDHGVVFADGGTTIDPTGFAVTMVAVAPEYSADGIALLLGNNLLDDGGTAGGELFHLFAGTAGGWDAARLTSLTSWPIADGQDTEGWVAGTGGFLGQLSGFLGNAPEATNSGTTADLLGLWSSGPDDVWAVGQGGVVLHSTGLGWTVGSAGVPDDLIAVWGRTVDGGTELFALSAGAVYRKAP